MFAWRRRRRRGGAGGGAGGVAAGPAAAWSWGSWRGSCVTGCTAGLVVMVGDLEPGGPGGGVSFLPRTGLRRWWRRRPAGCARRWWRCSCRMRTGAWRQAAAGQGAAAWRGAERAGSGAISSACRRSRFARSPGAGFPGWQGSRWWLPGDPGSGDPRPGRGRTVGRRAGSPARCRRWRGPGIDELIEEFPDSEPALVRTLSAFASLGKFGVFLGQQPAGPRMEPRSPSGVVRCRSCGPTGARTGSTGR